MTLVKGDGTVLGKTPGGTVLESVSEADPQVKVLIPVYKESPYEGTNYPTRERQIRFYEGQIIRQSEWDGQFTAPAISAISPATGGAAGGTNVTITGKDFTLDTTVTFGGNAATGVNIVTPTTLKCVTPAHAAGAVNVVVTASGGSATKTGGFTYS
ncbi:IPT/TIG domain-containing protein [Microbispora sp. NPDC049125]|uniref:IPT/TIG domain-containing protein n=1 Tax=Microbispora sp. NPDC049125 TaxID=3154929 RepID=UPI0034671A75